LLGSFLVLLGWYFVASYVVHQQLPPVREKLLTRHDDLLAVDGFEDGKKVAVGKFGLILVTSDNGKTWERRTSNTSKTLSAISFGDRNHALAVGSGGTILATSDGAASWRAQASASNDQLLGVQVFDSRHAHVVGAFGTLLSTSDGGQNWIRQEFKWDHLIGKIINESGYVEPNLNSIHFSSPMKGWIVGEFGLVLHTEDGGNTWTSQRYGNELPQLYSVKFVDDQHGWAVGQAGSLIRTNDGGKRWEAIDLSSKRDLYSLAFDGKHGVIVGEEIALISDDLGSTWKPLKMNSADQWLAGVVVQNPNAIGVGVSGRIQLLNLPTSVAGESR